MSSLRKLILILIVVGVALLGYRIYSVYKSSELIIREIAVSIPNNLADVQEEYDSLLKILKSTDCGESYPISIQTTKVTYHFHKNSALVTHTTTEIFEKYLVRECFGWLKDTCRYDEKEFNQLIKSLSEIRFKVAEKDETLEKLEKQLALIGIVGGPGFYFSFEVDSGRYLQYDHSQILLGDYQRVADIINQFIIAHPSHKEKAAREEIENMRKKIHDLSLQK